MGNRMQMKLLFEFLSQLASTDNNDVTSQLLAGIFAPYICNAESRAFMSIRHMEDLPALGCVVRLAIEQFGYIFKEPFAVATDDVRESAAQEAQEQEEEQEGKCAGEVMSATESMNLLQALMSVTVNGLLFSPLDGDIKIPIHGSSPGGLAKSFSDSCVVGTPPVTTPQDRKGAIVSSVEGSATAAGTSKRRQAVQACRQLKASIKVVVSGGRFKNTRTS